ncbi:MAG TPA: thioredoxin [Polyangia bacterium]|jgi:thioredoxin 2
MAGSLVRACPGCGAKNRTPYEHLAHLGRCGACKAALAPIAEPIDADGVRFDGIVSASPVPVLVDFWAPWCGPCRVAAPQVKKVAHAMAGRAVVLKVNTDEQPALAQRFHVQGIPNFLVLNRGQVVSQQAGMVDAQQMQRWLEGAETSAAR